jgi:hypothetical protein
MQCALGECKALMAQSILWRRWGGWRTNKAIYSLGKMASCHSAVLMFTVGEDVFFYSSCILKQEGNVDSSCLWSRLYKKLLFFTPVKTPAGGVASFSVGPGKNVWSCSGFSLSEFLRSNKRWTFFYRSIRYPYLYNVNWKCSSLRFRAT